MVVRFQDAVTGLCMGNRSQELLDQAKLGSSVDIGQVLSLYTQYLHSLAHSQLDRRVRGRVSPSDLVQETLLEAHRDFNNFRGTTVAELVGWLRRILIHNLIRVSEQHVRAEKRDVRREVSIQRLVRGPGNADSNADMVLAAPTESPSELIRGQEQSIALSEAIHQLPADQRQVVIMRHIEGLGFNDIAQRLGRSSGACRMLWLRAVDQLRGKLLEGIGS